MESIIYSYLINSYNCINNDEEFLNCLLILSINNLNITFNELLNYCYDNNYLKYQKKRKTLLNEKNDYLCDFKGLNDRQFEIINYHTQILNCFYSKISNEEIIYKHSITDNNNETINRNKRIAFDCSILLIIKNNLNHIITINNNNNNQNNNNYNNNNNFKESKETCILINNSKEILNNNNNKLKNNSNNYFERNYNLFKKVWGNMIIRKQILFHLRIYNNLSCGFYGIPIKEITPYKYRNYFKNVKLIIEDNNGEIGFTPLTNRFYPLPYGVERVEVDCSSITIGNHWIPETCKSIYFHNFNQQKLNRNIISNSLTTIFFGNSFNQPLSDLNGTPWLPKKLKTLSLGQSFQQTIQRNELPESLTELFLDSEYQGIILNESIPKSVTTLHYEFFTIRKNHFDTKSISKGVTSLKIGCYFNQTIKKDMIPINVTSLKIDNISKIEIEPNSLPISIKTLRIGSIELDRENILPPNIKKLSIYGHYHSCYLPKSIESLKITSFFNLSKISFNNFRNLTSLKIEKLSESVLEEGVFPYSLLRLVLSCPNLKLCNGIFPNSLKKLKLKEFNHPIANGDLPSSIEVLKLPNYNKPIKNGDLPSSLIVLKLRDHCIYTIERDALPPNLKSFYFHGRELRKLPNLIWPPSFEFAYISETSFNFINSIDLDFFTNHIRLNNIIKCFSY
ncbi:hypothetical protein ACTFIY_003170 [Dictyostelium cf. discoideum]